MVTGLSLKYALDKLRGRRFSGVLYADGQLQEGDYRYMPEQLGMEVMNAPGDLPPFIRLAWSETEMRDKVFVPDEQLAVDEPTDLYLFRLYDPRILPIDSQNIKQAGPNKWIVHYNIRDLELSLPEDAFDWLKDNNALEQVVELVLDDHGDFPLKEMTQQDFLASGPRMRLVFSAME